jgi:hypothetical protein
MNQARAKPSGNSHAGGLIAWTRVGGGYGNWASAFGDIRTFRANLPLLKT